MTTGQPVHPLIYNMIPTVIESGPRSERAFDIFSLLLKERIVFLGTPIDDHVANLIVAQLLYLSARTQRDISMYIIARRRVNAGLASRHHALMSQLPHRRGQTASWRRCCCALARRAALRSPERHRRKCTRRWRARARLDIEMREEISEQRDHPNIIASTRANRLASADFDGLYLMPRAQRYGCRRAAHPARRYEVERGHTTGHQPHQSVQYHCSSAGRTRTRFAG